MNKITISLIFIVIAFLLQALLPYKIAVAQKPAVQKLDPSVDNFTQLSANHFLSKTPPPVISGEPPTQNATFLQGIDKEDCLRVRNNIQIAFDNMDKTWPSIVRLINDDNYSITIQKEYSIKNYTIGKLSAHIIDISLAAAVFDALESDDDFSPMLPEVYYRKIKSVSRLQSKPPKDWLQGYIDRNAEFYEIQVDTLIWTKDLILDSTSISNEDKIYYSRKLDEQIVKIKLAKESVRAREVFEYSFFRPLPSVRRPVQKLEADQKMNFHK